MQNEEFKKMWWKIDSTSDSHTETLDALTEEINHSVLSIPNRIILNGFIVAKKEYADIKKMCSGNDHAFNLAADRLTAFRNYLDKL